MLPWLIRAVEAYQCGLVLWVGLGWVATVPVRRGARTRWVRRQVDRAFERPLEWLRREWPLRCGAIDYTPAAWFLTLEIVVRLLRAWQ